MNRTLGKRLKTLGFLRIGWCGVSEVNDTTPSPSLAEGAFETSFGPPPTRPTHQTEKANLPNGNTLTGVTKQSYCRVLEPIFPTGTKAPESLAATLHAAADESESLRFMGTINFCLRKSSLPMNLCALDRCSGRQDAALTGRLEARRYLPSPRLRKEVLN